MPRRARMYLPGHPYHIVQRGNNREVCFIEPENYQFLLGIMARMCLPLWCSYACVLSYDKPYPCAGNNWWEGRHRSSLVQSI